MPVHRQNFPRTLRTTAIYGPGLIGGSLALALLEGGSAVRLWSRRDSAIDEIKKLLPACTASTDPIETAKGADTLVFCTPIGAMKELGGKIAPHVAPDALVTDAGSTKRSVIDDLEPIFGGRFIGSHPMAGSEKSGLSAARPNLFQNATCVLTPTSKTPADTVEKARAFWNTVGAKVIEMDAAEHDRAASRISHLPHAIAAVLVNSIHQNTPQAVAIAGGGYRDTTRIAAGPAPMWREILLENRDELIAGLDEFSDMLNELKHFLATNDAASLEAFLAKASEAREKIS